MHLYSLYNAVVKSLINGTETSNCLYNYSCKDWLTLNLKQINPGRVSAGRSEVECMCAVVAVGAVTVISPLELIRTKMQSRQLSYRELGVCIQSSVAQGGWLSLWRGWGPTILRDVPFSGTRLSSFEHLLFLFRVLEHFPLQ